MSKLESRPSRSHAWEYVFWMDLDADLSAPEAAPALARAARGRRGRARDGLLPAGRGALLSVAGRRPGGLVRSGWALRRLPGRAYVIRPMAAAHADGLLGMTRHQPRGRTTAEDPPLPLSRSLSRLGTAAVLSALTFALVAAPTSAAGKMRVVDNDGKGSATNCNATTKATFKGSRRRSTRPPPETSSRSAPAPTGQSEDLRRARRPHRSCPPRRKGATIKAPDAYEPVRITIVRSMRCT